MAKFCKYCGKELVDGRCDCADFVAANPVVAETKEEAAKAAEPVVENVTAASEIVTEKAADAAEQTQTTAEKAQEAAATAKEKAQAAAAATGAAVAGAVNAVQQKTGVNFAELFGNVWRLFLKGFKAPMSAIKEAEEDKNHLAAFTFGGIYLLLIFLTFLIHLPIGKASKYLGIGFRAGFGWWSLFFIAVTILVNALFTWVFGKKHTEGQTFKKTLAGLCMSNVYPCTAIVVAFVFGFFASGIAYLAIGIAVSFWVSIITINVQRLLKGATDDGRVLIAFIYTLICGTISMIVGGMVLGGMISGVVNSAVSSLTGWY